MKVLLTNDDGIHAPGLWALQRAFADDHQVTVVAPDRERSAVGHGITLHQPVRWQHVRVNGGLSGMAVDGTPADCIMLGLSELLDEAPDLVVAGINPGANVGININYSGTVAAAREAAMAGIPAMAVSIVAPGDRHMDAAARFAASLAGQVQRRGLPAGTLINVNLPDLPMERIRGVRWSRQGNGITTQRFEKRTDPRNRDYYWQGCDPQADYNQPDIDAAAVKNSYISITPIKCDLTDYDALRDLGEWDLSMVP